MAVPAEDGARAARSKEKHHESETPDDRLEDINTSGADGREAIETKNRKKDKSRGPEEQENCFIVVQSYDTLFPRAHLCCISRRHSIMIYCFASTSNYTARTNTYFGGSNNLNIAQFQKLRTSIKSCKNFCPMSNPLGVSKTRRIHDQRSPVAKE